MEQSPEKFQFKKKTIRRKVQVNFKGKTWKRIQPFFNEVYVEAIKGLNRDDLLFIIKHMGRLCEQCGQCCKRSGSVITVTEKDISRLLKLLKTSKVLHQYFHFIDGQWRFKHKTCCAFLKNSSCSIYSYRPTACRVYPITELNGKLTARFHKLCKIPENLMVYKIVKQLHSHLEEKEKG